MPLRKSSMHKKKGEILTGICPFFMHSSMQQGAGQRYPCHKVTYAVKK
jgi:hypothetical protein